MNFFGFFRIFKNTLECGGGMDGGEVGGGITVIVTNHFKKNPLHLHIGCVILVGIKIANFTIYLLTNFSSI